MPKPPVASLPPGSKKAAILNFTISPGPPCMLRSSDPSTEPPDLSPPANFCDPKGSDRSLPAPFRCGSGDGCLPQPLLGYEHRRSPGDHHGHTVLQRQDPRVSVLRCGQEQPWLSSGFQAALSTRERRPHPKGLHPCPGRGWESRECGGSFPWSFTNSLSVSQVRGLPHLRRAADGGPR